jgi:hypothetical protein
MLIGGIAGGADGGPFGPFQPKAKLSRAFSAKQPACISPPVDTTGIQYRQWDEFFKADLARRAIHPPFGRARPAQIAVCRNPVAGAASRR